LIRRRKEKRAEHSNHERWLVSYADFITLLFALFVTLYAISQVDAKKLAKLTQSMQSAFDTRAFDVGSRKLSLSEGVTPGIDQQKLIETEEPVSSERDPFLKDLNQSIQGRFISENSADKVRINQTRRGLVISLTEAGFFDSGAATMKGSARRVLDAIAESVLQIPNQIRIEGHTDTTPIHMTLFPSNWELSTARATYIIAYLTSHFPFPPSRLSVAGYGEFRPVTSNASAEGRAMNRRVDLVVLSETASKQEPH
jgi:chemotaxis protein MotB